MSKINVNLDEKYSELILEFEYSEQTNAILRTVYGARFNRESKTWRVPVAALEDLINTLGARLQFSTPYKKIVAHLDRVVPIMGAVDMRVLDIMKIKPYSYQIIGGTAFLPEVKCGILADLPGLGKCVLPETRVLVGNSFAEISKLWENYAQESVFDGEGYWANPSQELYVPSMKDGKVVYSKVKRLYRQWINAPIKIAKLSNGSVLKATLTEKLFDGYEWKDNLQVGECVAIPSFVPGYRNYNDINVCPSLIELVAWQLAEGHEAPGKRYGFKIYQDDLTVISRIVKLLSDIGIPSKIIKEKGKCLCVSSHSKNYKDFLTRYGYNWGARSQDKQIPSFIFDLPNDLLRFFIATFFDCESSVNVDCGNIELTSASSNIIFGIKQLLLRFGIKMNTSECMKCATNGSKIKRKYYRGYISGYDLKRFFYKIGYNYEYKMTALAQIIDRQCNSNIYVYPVKKVFESFTDRVKIPAMHLGYRLDYFMTKKLPSIDGLQEMIKGFNSVLSGEAESNYRKLKPSKWIKQTIEAYQTADWGLIREVSDKLNWFLNSNLDYVRIDSINYEHYSGWVYDLEIEDNHNFIAEGMFVHNTVQTFLGFTTLFMRGEVTKCLVFCKKSLKSQWLDELERFTPFTGIKVYGDAENRAFLYEQALDPKYQFVFVSYDYLQHDERYVMSQAKKGHSGFHDFWYLHRLARACEVIVLDEAQKIKNSGSKIHKNMIKLCFSTSKKNPFDPPKYRWALTGTPIENSPMDLYNLCKFVNPQIFGQNPRPFNYRYFKDKYHTKIKEEKMDDLKLRIAPFMLRRTQEVAEKDFPEVLPPEFIKLDMEPTQARLHHIIQKELKSYLEGEEEFVIGSFSLLLQVADNPLLLKTSESDVGKKLYQEFRERILAEECPKIEWVYDYLSARKMFYPESKAILFTRSDDMARIIKERLLDLYQDHEILIFEGSLTESQQKEIKARFWDDSKILIATEAGSEGLNLQCADLLINIDLPYNPSRMSQRIGRICRADSKFKHVRVINLISKDSIDEKILNIIYIKQNFIDHIIDGNITDMQLSRKLIGELLAG